MELTIRPFEPADREAVVALADRLQVGVAPWRDLGKVRAAVRAWVAASVDGISETSAVLVAQSDAGLVGFVAVEQEAHWSGEPDAYIGELVVREDQEGRGIGRQLVRAAEDWAVGQGLRRIRLATGAANEGALRLYETAGYQREDVVLSRGLDASGTEAHPRS